MQAVNFTIDDSGVVYTNETQYIYDIEGVNWYDPTTASVKGARLIAVKITNLSPSSGGFIMSFGYGGCLTNSSNWKCTATSFANWYSTRFFIITMLITIK